MNLNINNQKNRTEKIILLMAIIGMSFSLRAPITSIGSLAGLIHEDLGVSNGFIGFVTTLPLLAFAVCSPFVSKVSMRFGTGRTVIGGMALIVIGGAIRSYSGTFGLLLGTAIIGIGISVGNVLTPSIVKLFFPNRLGIITSIYITGMALFASIGAGASYPVAMTGLGWKSAAFVWIGMAVITIFIWIPLRNLGKDQKIKEFEKTETNKTINKNIWKSPLAWFITLFMGFQSLTFYSLTAWLPSILQSDGMTPEVAGYMALWFQLIGIPSSFITPIIAARIKNQKNIVIGSCVSFFAGLIVLMMIHSVIGVMLALLLISSGGAACFSWSMVMISIKGKDAEEAAKLSGMSQSIGYLLAATGPTMCGIIYDINPDWTIILILFMIINFLMWFAGIAAAKRDKLFH